MQRKKNNSDINTVNPVFLVPFHVSNALRACPQLRGFATQSRARSQFANVFENKFSNIGSLLTLLTRKKHLFLRRGVVYTVPLNFYKSRQMRLLISLHDNDCRRTRLPAYALTRPLRNALHRNLPPELLSAGDSSSLLLSFSVTLFFTAFSLLSSLYAEGTGFVKEKGK